MKSRYQFGVALIEFAFIVPLMLLIVLVTVDFGRALYNYNGLVKAVRNATRFLTTEAPDNSVAATKARNLVVYGNVAGVGQPLDPSVTVDKVDIPPTAFIGSAPNPVIRTVTVRVTGYTFSPMVNVFLGHRFSGFTFSDVYATMRHPL